MKQILVKVAREFQMDYKEVLMIYSLMYSEIGKAMTINGGMKKIILHGLCVFDVKFVNLFKRACKYSSIMRARPDIDSTQMEKFFKIYNQRKSIYLERKAKDKRFKPSRNDSKRARVNNRVSAETKGDREQVDK